MPTKREQLTTYIDADLKRKVMLLAAKQSRTASNLLEFLLKEVVAKAESEGVDLSGE
jgi:hypothetical protein